MKHIYFLIISVNHVTIQEKRCIVKMNIEHFVTSGGTLSTETIRYMIFFAAISLRI